MAEMAQLIRQPEVKAMTGIKADSTLREMIQRGDFPRPIKVGRANYWPRSVVQSWIDALASAEDDNEDVPF